MTGTCTWHLHLAGTCTSHRHSCMSIGIAANGSDGHAAPRGLDTTHDLVIVFLKANPDPKKLPWCQRIVPSIPMI